MMVDRRPRSKPADARISRALPGCYAREVNIFAKGAGRRRPTNEPLRDANGGPTRYGVPPSKNEGSRARLSLPIIPTDRKPRLTLRSAERYSRDPCSQ
jgi:hypothetical protein